jgi:hypothetical protein
VKPHEDKIANLLTFHTHKNEFNAAFGDKIDCLHVLVNKVKSECEQELFQKGLIFSHNASKATLNLQ